MDNSRRRFISAAGAGAFGSLLSWPIAAEEAPANTKRHLITIGFDDGFKKSSIRTAEIYEKFKLSACLNVIATGHRPDFVAPDQYQAGIPKGDFGLWNELQARGHEIMPHGYKHANKRQMPLAEAQDLIRRCLDVFSRELKGFEPKRAVFNFPYNASTPELNAWMPTQVRAFRVGGGGINPLPHASQVKLTTTGFGPGNAEATLDKEMETLLAKPSGWLVFTAHGLDDEGWGPLRGVYLERLLERLTNIDSVRLLPAAKALAEVG